jgi:hypothetical protein
MEGNLVRFFLPLRPSRFGCLRELLPCCRAHCPLRTRGSLCPSLRPHFFRGFGDALSASSADARTCSCPSLSWLVDPWCRPSLKGRGIANGPAIQRFNCVNGLVYTISFRSKIRKYSASVHSDPPIIFKLPRDKINSWDKSGIVSMSGSKSHEGFGAIIYRIGSRISRIIDGRLQRESQRH